VHASSLSDINTGLFRAVLLEKGGHCSQPEVRKLHSDFLTLVYFLMLEDTSFFAAQLLIKSLGNSERAEDAKQTSNIHLKRNKYLKIRSHGICSEKQSEACIKNL
jgi:hypothetical protein